MKYVILGGVAAGIKAAAKLKRMDCSSEVVLYTKSKDVSYAGCGLPYYIGGDIATRDALIVNTPESFRGLTGVEIHTGCEATSLNAAEKTVTIKTINGEENVPYDKLVIGVGASPVIPYVAGTGLNGVFAVRTPDDAVNIRAYVEANSVKKAVVVGAGFIGLEVAENLFSSGVDVTVIDAAAQIMPNAFDSEMSGFAKRQLKNAGLRVLTSTGLKEINGDEKVEGVVTDNGTIPCELVILAVGVRPATAFLENSGLEMVKGTIVTDGELKTNIPDVYAVGDCALVKNMITGKNQWSAMGSTANIAARAMAKGDVYKGTLATGVAKILPSLNVGRTGLTEKEAKEAGYDVTTVVLAVNDIPAYYPGSSSFVIKMIAETGTEKLLGIQVIGAGAVDKMTDIAVTGISAGMKLHDFDTLDLAYAPPFSTAISPFVTACMVLENKIEGALSSMTPYEYLNGDAKDYTVVDCQAAPTIANAKWVDITKVTEPVDGLDLDAKILLVCTRGRRAYILQNKLKALGYTNTKVLEGGTFVSEVKVPRNGRKLTPEDIARVKGLGCLKDKRYDDIFNVRVITRNGKLTTEEHMRIAEAAKIYGSGVVTMTTRLTLEVQGVPYDNLDDLFAYLKEFGIDCGGTGSKVRPVVSCKGTTCQYGLIDTFELSEKLHEIFYLGYHGVSLPHKFKIAVGGCPNNCVKPSLNDLGIIGQRIPELDLSKCRGCKVCQVENSCPIKVASVVDGKVKINTDECNHCGRCVGKCPFGALEESTYGYKVYIGGRWGKKMAQGQPISKIFTTEEEIIAFVEKVILFFRDEGITGERLADTVARLGFDYVENKLLTSTIDKSKILEKTVIGGATC